MTEENKNYSPPPQGGYITDDELRSQVWVLAKKQATEPISLEKVASILSKTIKHDAKNKLIVFLLMLLFKTTEDQQNISFNAPSSAGKSWIALEDAAYFPPEDVFYHSYTSPTAFFHELGKLTTLDGEPLKELREYVEDEIESWESENKRPSERGEITDWRERRKAEIRKTKTKWEKIEKVYEVNLEGKILIFIDQPHDRLLQVLRAFLSHDRKRLNVKITDKTKEGGNRTKNIVVVGYPTVVFCSASFMLDEQERTRFWILSPEISSDKFKDTLKLQAEILSDRIAYRSRLANDLDRMVLMERIEAIKGSGVKEVVLEAEDSDHLYKRFLESHPRLSARCQRDFPRVIALTKAIALLNLFQRRYEGEKAYAMREDADEALKLMEGVSEANDLGIPPYIWKFFKDAVEPVLAEGGISRIQFNILYFNYYHSRLGEKERKRILDLLSEAGLIYEDTDPENRRLMRIYPPQGGGEKNISQEGPKLQDFVGESETPLQEDPPSECARCRRPIKPSDAWALIEGFAYCESCKAKIVKERLGGT